MWVTIKGLSAHSGWHYSHTHPGYPLEGVNVIEKAVKIMNAILRP
ncbi:hypothetical protein [Brevibacillus nitrificans]|nr:hypothetical protein [Brevibacillus nitrificans]MDR7317595.1 hypothetical protein [Brevibacillus nitrificans]